MWGVVSTLAPLCSLATREPAELGMTRPMYIHISERTGKGTAGETRVVSTPLRVWAG